MSTMRSHGNRLAALLLGAGLVGGVALAADAAAPRATTGGVLWAQPSAGNDDADDAEGNHGQAGALDDGRELLPKAKISLKEAIAAARGAAPGAIGEVDLERVRGRLVFNVDVGDKDVKVDAATGEVLAVDAED